jgi:aminoglycoside 3-N-acetyltransferase
MTFDDLVADLRALGVRPGRPLLVHASLRRLGRLPSGAGTVVDALHEVLGPGATIVVPTATADNSVTSRTHLARTRGMTIAQQRLYRETMPAFDADLTPAIGMGAFAEHIRTSPGALRSRHPQTSFAALGPLAKVIVDGHAMDCHLGEESPLARLYEADAEVLMLGTGYETCTALHLAEYRYTADPPRRNYSCVIEQMGEPTWWTYEDVVLDDRDFPALGAAFDATSGARRGRVCSADTRLMAMRQVVDFAINWLAATRKIVKNPLSGEEVSSLLPSV